MADGLRHLAIIMDGNGRWAKQRNLARLEGHKEGAKRVADALRFAKKHGIEYLTLYAFSTENWKRPMDEVNGLMNLMNEFLDNQLEELQKENVCLKTIGRFEGLPAKNQKKLRQVIEATKNNSAGTLILALNYGGRSEIVDATKKIAEDVKNGCISTAKIDEKLFANYLYDPTIPDPDLVIRTSGEIRISNFLLWQIAYSEIYVTNTLWPDCNESQLELALQNFKARIRRLGGI